MSARLAALSEICDFNPRLPSTLKDDEIAAFIPMAAVSENGNIAFEEERPVREVRKGYSYFERGDVLVAKITPCFENGKATRTSALTKSRGFGSTEFHVLRAGKEIDPDYLFHLLWNDKFRAVASNNMTGSAGQKRVPADFLKRLSVPLPPLDEQRRIAAILDKADALRRKRKRALDLLDNLTQSIFLEMFGDGSRWNVIHPLGELSDIVSGITKGRKLNVETVRPIGYLAVANVQDKRLNLTKVKTIDATEDEISRYRLRQDDLLLTEGGDPDKLGRGTLWNDEIEEVIHQNHIFRVRVGSDDLLPLYLMWLVGSAYGKSYFLRSAKQTTGIASINKQQLSSFPVPMPPLRLQKSFANALEKVQYFLNDAVKARAMADMLFTSLQSRAFSGQL